MIEIFFGVLLFVAMVLSFNICLECKGKQWFVFWVICSIITTFLTIFYLACTIGGLS